MPRRQRGEMRFFYHHWGILRLALSQNALYFGGMILQKLHDGGVPKAKVAL
jgi:hypothetical protein